MLVPHLARAGTTYGQRVLCLVDSDDGLTCLRIQHARIGCLNLVELCENLLSTMLERFCGLDLLCPECNRAFFCDVAASHPKKETGWVPRIQL